MNDYQFIKADTAELVANMTAAYEKITNKSLHPASPDRLFVLWVADVIVQISANINIAANQNIPSRAIGENLDALAELFYTKQRPQAKPATCTMRFYISEPQLSAILIPSGTRVTDSSRILMWETVGDVYVEAGETFTDVQVQCQSVGTIGNGYLTKQINTIVDVYAYYSGCENTTISAGGTNTATDAEFYALLRASEDAYSTAGPTGAYEYHAKNVSTAIADVRAIQPRRTISKRLKIYAGHAFIGGDNLYPESLNVASGTVATDYTVTYEDGLLDIAIVQGGNLDGDDVLDVTYQTNEAGCVNIYALMDDGTPAGDTIKSLIEQACKGDTARPLTDRVVVTDPEVVEYDIDLTYYLDRESAVSAAQVQAAVESAVAEFITWEHGRLGRDINPSKLRSMLMATGIKREDVRSPAFTHLRDGRDHQTPQLARIRNVTITAGGYEDE